jgi:hypothetical protein
VDYLVTQRFLSSTNSFAYLGQNTDGEPYGHLRTVPGNGIRVGVQLQIRRHWHAASTQLGHVDLPDLLTALPGTSGAGRVECLAERSPPFLPLALISVPALERAIVPPVYVVAESRLIRPPDRRRGLAVEDHTQILPVLPVCQVPVPGRQMSSGT